MAEVEEYDGDDYNDEEYTEESYHSDDDDDDDDDNESRSSRSYSSGSQNASQSDTMRDRSFSGHASEHPSERSDRSYTSASYTSPSRGSGGSSRRSLGSKSQSTANGSRRSEADGSVRCSFDEETSASNSRRSGMSGSRRSTMLGEDGASSRSASSHAASFEDKTVSSQASSRQSSQRQSSFAEKSFGSRSVSTRSRSQQPSQSDVDDASSSRRTEESRSQQSRSQHDHSSSSRRTEENRSQPSESGGGETSSSRRTEGSRSQQSESQQDGSWSRRSEGNSRSQRSHQSLSRSSRSTTGARSSSRRDMGVVSEQSPQTQNSTREDSYRGSFSNNESKSSKGRENNVSFSNRSGNSSFRSKGEQSASKSTSSRKNVTFSNRSETSRKYSTDHEGQGLSSAKHDNFGFHPESSNSSRSEVIKSSGRSHSERSSSEKEDRSKTSESLSTSHRESKVGAPLSPFGNDGSKSSQSMTSHASSQRRSRDLTHPPSLGNDSQMPSKSGTSHASKQNKSPLSPSGNSSQQSSKSQSSRGSSSRGGSSMSPSRRLDDSFSSQDSSSKADTTNKSEKGADETSNFGSGSMLAQTTDSTTKRNDFHSKRLASVNGTHSIAVLGTMNDAGKSVITAAICRILANNNTRVAPFKAQTMSNNSAAALLPDGERRDRLYRSIEKVSKRQFPLNPINEQGYGEIGAVQAEACKIPPRVEMNPILLKSGGKNEKGEDMCSVVVLGKHLMRETYGDLHNRTSSLRQMVIESHRALAVATGAKIIVIEGAGSCTELNRMDGDIVNLPLVRALQCPWLLVANMDCGGVFAQVVGTRMCVPEKDWEMCVGVIINKLRGEEEHFEPGPTILERMVGKPVFIVPFLDNLHLPEEDGLGLEQRLSWEKHGNQRSENKENKPVVVVVAYPYTSIADDLFPLEQDERFHVEWRRKRIPKPYPSTTAVILPGSRRTMIDLKWLFDSGWANFIRRHRSAGGVVLGLCGGYQMLGRNVADPDGTEGIAEMRQGIGLFPISTTIAPPQCKVVTRRNAQLYPSGIHVEGFELHCGVLQVLPEQVQSIGRACGISPLLAFEDGRPEGMRLGSVKGTYLHGILRSAKARVELLVANPKFFPSLKNAETVEEPLDRLANHLESCGLDCNVLNSMIFGRREDHDRDYGKEEKSDESTKKHAEKQQKVGLPAPPSPPRL